MISLYVGSTSGYSGKSLASMELGFKFKKDGLRVGYIKPVGILPIKIENMLSDKDAWFIYRALELKDPISEICPVVLTQELTVKSYQKDIKDLKDHFIGVIFNKVTHEYKQGIDDYIVPFLKRTGVDIIGILPQDPLVGSITVEELNEMLGGKVLCCHDRLSNLVERFLIGAMQVDRATEYFKRTKNNAVIVGGDRADIQLSAIESGTECLVLTGELYPSEVIVSRAEQKNIPIIVIRDDTYTVAKKVERLSVRLRLRDKAKVAHGTELVMKNVNFPLLYKHLGITIGQ